jgi:hypothetical protein
VSCPLSIAAESLTHAYDSLRLQVHAQVNPKKSVSGFYC